MEDCGGALWWCSELLAELFKELFKELIASKQAGNVGSRLAKGQSGSRQVV